MNELGLHNQHYATLKDKRAWVFILFFTPTFSLGLAIPRNTPLNNSQYILHYNINTYKYLNKNTYKRYKHILNTFK